LGHSPRKRQKEGQNIITHKIENRPPFPDEYAPQSDHPNGKPTTSPTKRRKSDKKSRERRKKRDKGKKERKKGRTPKLSTSHSTAGALCVAMTRASSGRSRWRADFAMSS
jgi:hypothetical protein